MPKTNKITFLGLIKSHISYLSIIIFFIGLTLKYSLPSLFPILNNFDIRYFGGILIQFGLLLLVGNWLIDKYKEEINRRLFSDILDEKIGLKGTPLLTELVNLTNPFSYNIVLYESIVHVTKLNNPKAKKYDIVQKIKIILQPKQDNVHYTFGLGTTEENGEQPKVNYIKLNKKNLIFSKEIEETKTSSLQGVIGRSYRILIPFKREKEYEIEISAITPHCMSDLDDGQESDDQIYEYRAFTEKTIIKHKYDFSKFRA